MLAKEISTMSGFFASDRNKAFVGGLVALVVSVYLKDRLPFDETQLKWLTDNATILITGWLVSRGIRKPEVAK
jgi:hypothetical protein